MKNNETALIILIIIMAIFLFSGAGMMGFGGMWGMMSGYNSGFMWFGWIFMTLIIVALVLFIVWLIKQLQNQNGKTK